MEPLTAEQIRSSSANCSRGERARLALPDLAVYEGDRLHISGTYVCGDLATSAHRALVRSVHSYAQWLRTHQRPHVRQVARTPAAVRVG